MDASDERADVLLEERQTKRHRHLLSPLMRRGTLPNAGARVRRSRSNPLGGGVAIGPRGWVGAGYQGTGALASLVVVAVLLVGSGSLARRVPIPTRGAFLNTCAAEIEIAPTALVSVPTLARMTMKTSVMAGFILASLTGCSNASTNQPSGRRGSRDRCPSLVGERELRP